MPYCAEADLILAYNTETILSMSREENDNGAIDSDKITAVCAEASALADDYLQSGSITTPFTETWASLKSRCIDVSVYFLARQEGAMRDDILTRYEQAIAWLELVAEGGVKAPLSTVGDIAASNQDLAMTQTQFDKRVKLW